MPLTRLTDRDFTVICIALRAMLVEAVQDAHGADAKLEELNTNENALLLDKLRTFESVWGLDKREENNG
jgi:hypothetical protein